MTYVTDAVQRFVAGLSERGLLAIARPVRIDGLVEAELDAVLPALEIIVAPGRVAVLASLTAEHLGRINSDRATRYRNEIDARDGGGFVLLLPHGGIPESSLNEPAFLVVTRDSLFRDALARRRTELSLSLGDVEGIRQSSRYRQAKSIFAFLSAWDDLTGVVAPVSTLRAPRTPGGQRSRRLAGGGCRAPSTSLAGNGANCTPGTIAD